MRTADVPRHVSLPIPAGSQRQLDVFQRLMVGFEDVLEQCNVCHRQAQRVDFGEAFLVRKRWNVVAQFVEGAVYAHHPPSLADVRRKPMVMMMMMLLMR